MTRLMPEMEANNELPEKLRRGAGRGDRVRVGTQHPETMGLWSLVWLTLGVKMIFVKDSPKAIGDQALNHKSPFTS